MQQILAKSHNKQDTLEYDGHNIYLTIQTQNDFTPWFAKCLRSVFPKVVYDKKMIIDADLMFKVCDLYVNTR